MQRPGVRRDPSDPASVAEGQPFVENASAACTVPVVALQPASETAIIATAAAPRKLSF